MKKILSLFLSVLMLTGMVTIGFSAFAASSGSCGDNVTYTLDGNTLTISGTGDMEDFSSGSSTPWYSDRTSIENVVINSGVTSIGQCAFMYCSNLTSVTIPNSVTSIGIRAFRCCSSITSVTIPGSVTFMGEYAFGDCTRLTNVTIETGATSISDCAFWCCTSLESIKIPDSVTSIGNHAFYTCTSLTSITIPDGVTSIGGYTFEYCSSLTSITIPDSVTSIGQCAFNYCSNLTSIKIPDGVTSIGYSTFGACKSLTIVTMPNSVTKIDDMAFIGCSSLTDVYYYGSEDEWNKMHIGTYNTSLTNATIHFLGSGPDEEEDDEEDEDEQSDVSFGFGGSLHTNVTFGLMGETVTLYGYFDTDDEDFDAASAIRGVTWSVNDNLAAVTSASATGYVTDVPTTTGEEKTRYEWAITVNLAEHGNAKITGTTANGDTASHTIVIEPEMVVDAPDAIYTLTSLNTPQQITCTVTIDESDPQYLENFMTKLGDEGNIKFEYVGYEETPPIVLKLDSSSYEISSDGKKAVYTINVYADHEYHVIQEDVITVKVTFSSPSGKEASVNTNLALYLPSIDAWSFPNSGQETSVDQFKLVFDYDGSNLAKKVFNKAKKGSEGGICYGMALSSVSTYSGNPSITEWISSNKAYSATQANQNSSSKNYGITLNDYMMGLFVYQYSYEAMNTKLNNTNKIENLITAVERFQSGSGNPVIISIRQDGQGHAVVGYEVERDGNEIRVYVYDCNYPGGNNQYISLTCNNSGSVTGWSYEIDTETTFASSTGGSLSYNDSVQNASNIVLSSSTVKLSSLDMLETDTTLLSSTADPFTITTSAGETVTYNNGNVEGTASGVVPIQADCYSLDNPDAVEDTADFYLDDIGMFTVQNNGSSDEKISTLYADDHSDITIYSDGQSTVTLNETNDVFNASVVPAVTDTVTMVFSTDDEKTVFEVEGVTGETTNMSAVCDENQVKFSGIDSGTVTVTSGETTTTVSFDSNGGDNEYYATLLSDGSVSVDPAAEVDNTNSGSTDNNGSTDSTGNTDNTGSTDGTDNTGNVSGSASGNTGNTGSASGSTGSASSSSAKSSDSTVETGNTGSASGSASSTSESADESSQGSNTTSSSSSKTSPATGISIGVVALVMVVSCGVAILTLIRRRKRNTD